MRCGVAVVGGILLIMLGAGGVEAARAARMPAARTATHGQVYVMRGFMGPVLSAGLEKLSARLEQRGIHAPTYPPGSDDSLADEALARYRAGNRGPIVIIGHSLGANSAIDMARKLQANHVPVSLIVTYGPNGDLRAPANVSSVVNYYQSQSYSAGRVLPGPGFRGSINNVDLQQSPEINHVNMVQVDRLQAQVIARVISLIGGGHGSRVSAGPASSALSSTATSARSQNSGAN
jgi:hypothetical protein